MKEAIFQAKKARSIDEVPVGAVLVRHGKILAAGHNSTISRKDPTAHAEVVVLRKAAKIIGNHRISKAHLYVTLEPCSMCAGAIVNARIENLIFGAFDYRSGAVGSAFDLLNNKRTNHKVNIIGGVQQEECLQILKGFFEERRSSDQKTKRTFC